MKRAPNGEHYHVGGNTYEQTGCKPVRPGGSQRRGAPNLSDACERGSFASEVARQITEMAFDELDAPPVVVASRNWITPAHELEESFFPQPSWILDAIDAKIVPLPGHVRVTDQSIEKKLSNERRGV